MTHFRDLFQDGYIHAFQLIFCTKIKSILFSTNLFKPTSIFQEPQWVCFSLFFLSLLVAVRTAVFTPSMFSSSGFCSTDLQRKAESPALCLPSASQSHKHQPSVSFFIFCSAFFLRKFLSIPITFCHYSLAIIKLEFLILTLSLDLQTS